MTNEMKKITQEEIDKFLGYSSDQEAKYKEVSVSVIQAERESLAQMVEQEALKKLYEKKDKLNAVRTSEAAVRLNMSQNMVLKGLRDKTLPGFKIPGGQWRVWIEK